MTESRYIYKNIQRKQKLIDYLQYLEEKKEKNSERVEKKTDKLLNSMEYDSIMKQSFFTTQDNNENESKHDLSVSVENLIEHISKAEKNIKSTINLENGKIFKNNFYKI